MRSIYYNFVGLFGHAFIAVVMTGDDVAQKKNVEKLDERMCHGVNYWFAKYI
jgi:hypothetical protein